VRPVDLFYRILNVPMRALLRSPLHRLMSGTLCLLNYRGRRSGTAFTTPLSFMREDQTIRLLSSHRTRWWKNFLDGDVPVEIEIAGESFSGRAQALLEDGEAFRDGVRRFLTEVPRDAVVYGIGLTNERRPREADVERAAGHIVLVEVQLDAG